MNNETVYAWCSNRVELYTWMIEQVGSKTGWYFAGGPSDRVPIVLCRDLQGNRENLKLLIALKWGTPI